MSEKGMGYYGDKISQLNSQLTLGVLCLWFCSFCELILAGDYKVSPLLSLCEVPTFSVLLKRCNWHWLLALPSFSEIHKYSKRNIKILHGAMKLWHSFTWAKCSSPSKCFQVDCYYFDKYTGVQNYFCRLRNLFLLTYKGWTPLLRHNNLSIPLFYAHLLITIIIAGTIVFIVHLIISLCMNTYK